jgi:uncharacterized protein (TIGR04255 family)
LTNLKIVEGVQIDPFYPMLLQKFTAAMAETGFGIVESRVPDDAPIELLAYQATRMFRQAANQWPVFQIGPGVFTANVVPPYGGWSSFVPHIEKGLSKLYSSYPDEFMLPQRATLRYLNAFKSSHGMSSPPTFIRNCLKLVCPLPDQIVSAAEGGKDAILQTGNIRIPLAIIPNATGRILWGAGRHNNEEAVTLELRVEMSATGEKSPSYVLSQLNKAHSTISVWFEALISDQLRSHFGDRREVRNG